jgi:anti-sigma regulatory factor (Ser/Thr protein kinase)
VGVGTLAVRHDRASAALVRHSIADDLAESGIDSDSIDDVVLVASELVGNAVRHAAASFDSSLAVSWDVEADAVVVRVLDGSPELPRQRSSNDNETSGRGLAIVAAVSADWGVRRNEHGKQVWARVAIARC